MVQSIRDKEFNFYPERCNEELKSHPRVTAKELKHNNQFPIQMETPYTVVINGGYNDISPKKNQEKLT